MVLNVFARSHSFSIFQILFYMGTYRANSVLALLCSPPYGCSSLFNQPPNNRQLDDFQPFTITSNAAANTLGVPVMGT